MKASLKIIHSILFVLILLSPEHSFGNKETNVDSVYKIIIHKTLKYLELNQIKSTNGTEYFYGEWPTYIENLKKIPFLGNKGKSAYDSNIFNTLFIHN